SKTAFSLRARPSRPVHRNPARSRRYLIPRTCSARPFVQSHTFRTPWGTITSATAASFEKQVLPEVNPRGIGALGRKSMGGTAWAIKNGILNAEELLRYAMSLAI